MSGLEFELPDLSGAATSLFSDRCTIAITSESGDCDWAVRATWSIARAASTTGRRIALVDLDLENPRLHTQMSDPKDIGIVDAFLFGASLQHVASRVESPNLHFIGVGTPPTDPEEVWASDRWQRLSRGFEKEGALLLLFLPPAGLEFLPFTPDLILAVSPRGFGPEGPKSPQIRSAIDRGVPVAVVTDSPSPAQAVETADSGEDTTHPEPLSDAGSGRSGLPLKILLSMFGVAVIAVAAVSMLSRSDEEIPLVLPTDSAPRTAEPLVEHLHDRPAPPRTADPLPYSIQVAAWARLSQAQDHVTRFQRAGLEATISVVPRDSSRVWYRVLVGAVPDYDSAGELRRRLREDGLIGPTRGVLLKTPYALLVATHADMSSGEAAVRGFRESGVPAYIVSLPDGSVQVLVGAFESPGQVELIDSVFPRAGHDPSMILVSRVGIAR